MELVQGVHYMENPYRIECARTLNTAINGHSLHIWFKLSFLH